MCYSDTIPNAQKTCNVTMTTLYPDTSDVNILLHLFILQSIQQTSYKNLSIITLVSLDITKYQYHKQYY